jgi:hypothetical protein
MIFISVVTATVTFWRLLWNVPSRNNHSINEASELINVKQTRRLKLHNGFHQRSTLQQTSEKKTKMYFLKQYFQQKCQKKIRKNNQNRNWQNSFNYLQDVAGRCFLMRPWDTEQSY